MRLSRKIRKTISLVVLGISGLVWLLLLVDPGNIHTVHHCPVMTMGPSQTSFQMLLEMNPISSLLTGWILMVIAMMLPKLILPIRYIYSRSIDRRRLRSALLFVFAYLGVWSAVGLVMTAAILGLNFLLPGSYLPAIGIGIIAFAWQFSPIKQRCLNRGHDHLTLAAFGWAADRDALLFGVIHGGWCVGSGWALMLFPMLLPAGHNLAMLFVAFVMISEHLEHPQSPRWRIYFSGRLMRFLFTQTRIRLVPGSLRP
jgi:predicted metal-binding membrane protein